METRLQLNENVIRFNALLTIIIASLVIIFKNEWLALFLSIDFFLSSQQVQTKLYLAPFQPIPKPLPDVLPAF